MDKKFIIVNDMKTAQRMIDCGFTYVAKFGNQYTFLNVIPKSFNFATLDSKQYIFSNTLSV